MTGSCLGCISCFQWNKLNQIIHDSICERYSLQKSPHKKVHIFFVIRTSDRKTNIVLYRGSALPKKNLIGSFVIVIGQKFPFLLTETIFITIQALRYIVIPSPLGTPLPSSQIWFNEKESTHIMCFQSSSGDLPIIHGPQPVLV